MFKIVVTENTEQSLNEIIDFYLTEHTIDRTQKVLNSIDEAFVKIANSPFHYPICFDIRTPQSTIRQFILHDTFKIIYRIQTDVIEIIEVFHCSRNPESIHDINS